MGFGSGVLQGFAFCFLFVQLFSDLVDNWVAGICFLLLLFCMGWVGMHWAGLGCWAGLGWAATGLGWAWLSSRTLKETSKLLKMLEDAVRSEIHAIFNLSCS